MKALATALAHAVRPPDDRSLTRVNSKTGVSGALLLRPPSRKGSDLPGCGSWIWMCADFCGYKLPNDINSVIAGGARCINMDFSASQSPSAESLSGNISRVVPSQDWLKFEGGVISSLSKQTRIGVSAPTEITPWRRIAQCLPQAPPKVNSFSAMIGSIP